VGTVDSFQGQERDIIAITLTRSNPQGEIGFLSDIRRMNVGMTRARRKLLLVGDSSTLGRHPFFVELLAYVKGVGGCGPLCTRRPAFQALKNPKSVWL
jgi:superfamily I DNA and/or RNA helicase